MKPVVIGLCGCPNKKEEFSCLCRENGIYTVKISDKVREIHGYATGNMTTCDEEIINKIREKAYKISKLYWISLVLSSINGEHKTIVIEDIRDEDCIPNLIEKMDLDKLDSISINQKIKRLLEDRKR